MDEQLRVAITLEQCWHRVPGGTATSIVELSRSLVAMPGLEMVGVSARHRSPPRTPFVPPLEVQALPLPRPVLYESWHALGWPPVERVTGVVDVVHATAVAIPPSRAPLVVTIHDLGFLGGSDRATRHGHRFFRRGLELARRHATLVLCPSRATMAECEAAGFEPERLRLVPWGVRATPTDESSVAQVRRVHRLLRPYVLFVGTAEPRKNLTAVVEGFRALGDRDLDLVLVGSTGWNEDLDRRIIPLGGRARRLGFVDPADLAALYAGCAAFCYPSLQEGFGLPVLEAMAQGAPVVTSAGTATEEVAADAALLVDPQDPTEVTVALARILDGPSLADDLRRRGQERAATYTWDRSAQLTVEAYAEAAHARTGDHSRRNRPRKPFAVASRPGFVAGPGRSRRNTPRKPLPIASRTGWPARIGVNLLWMVPGVVGGSEEYTTRLLAAMAEHPVPDLHLTLFVLEPFVAAHPDLVAAYPTVMIRLDGARKPVRILAENTWLSARARARRIDLLHHAGGVVPPLRATPGIVTIHDLQSLAMPANFSPAKRVYHAVLVPQSVQTARLVITPSDHAGREVVERLGVPPELVCTVPHGIAPVGDPPSGAERAAVRARHGLTSDQRFFVYPAITYPHKNHALLVDAFRQVASEVPDVALLLPGGTAQEEESLVRHIAALGLADRVRRLGRIPRFDLDVLLGEATALTCPSLYEGFGAPLLEAMARACPVIAADATALPEVVGGAGILVAPSDPDAWAAAMTMMLTDDVRRVELSTAGLARAATFTWQRSATALASAYRRALA